VSGVSISGGGVTIVGSPKANEIVECACAERLRNIALVSISRELKVLSRLRDMATKSTDLSLRKQQNIIQLRKKTDLDRKALQDHIANCRDCRNVDQQNPSESAENTSS
jgi:hypothetical protein